MNFLSITVQNFVSRKPSTSTRKEDIKANGQKKTKLKEEEDIIGSTLTEKEIQELVEDWDYEMLRDSVKKELFKKKEMEPDKKSKEEQNNELNNKENQQQNKTVQKESDTEPDTEPETEPYTEPNTDVSFDYGTDSPLSPELIKPSYKKDKDNFKKKNIKC